DLGKEQVAKSAKEIKERIKPEDDVLIASSPKARARGSADIIRRELGVEEGGRILKSMRSVEVRDWAKARQILDEILGPGVGNNIPKVDKAYVSDPRFEMMPDVWEPKSNVEKRSMSGLGHLAGFMEKYRSEHQDRIPHLVAVSHFEFLNHIVRKLFDLDRDDADQLRTGEMIQITLLKGTEEGKKIPMMITFRGQTKEVLFDNEKKAFEILGEES
ncbi:MAG: histidine phosphatase family protein, partial [Candidatus Wolfebacteria bacterium]|nr:histidine phosphatase family protein [Candidatus Wolfebacteria bacterium]